MDHYFSSEGTLEQSYRWLEALLLFLHYSWGITSLTHGYRVLSVERK